MTYAKSLKWTAIVVFGILFVYPLLRFFMIAFVPALSPVHSQPGLLTGHLARSAANTLVLGAVAALISAPLGAGLSWYIENRSGWVTRSYTAALWILFFLPSYVLTTGYQSLLTLGPLENSAVNRLFYSKVGVVFMLALKAVPFSVFVARSTWANIDTDLADSVSVHSVNRWTRLGLLARLALPALAAAFVVGFIESIQDFGIPATLGASSHLQLITYAIYEQVSTTPLNFVNAARLSLYLLVMASAAALLHWHVQRKYRFTLLSGRNRRVTKPSSGTTEDIAMTGGLAIVWSLAVIIPLFALIHSALGSFSLTYIDSLYHSMVFAFIAATFCTMIATFIARLVVSSRSFWIAALEGLSLVNMAVPGLILGAAYLMAFNNAIFPLYGTALLLIVAYVAGTTPMITRLMQAPIGQIDSSISDAARVHGLNAVKRFLDIDAVLLSGPVTHGWSLAFGTILFELPISALLYPAGLTPLGVSIMNLNQEFEFGKASLLAIAGLATALVMRIIMTTFAQSNTAPRYGEEVRL